MAGGNYQPGPIRVRKISYGDDTEFPGLWLRVGGLTIDEWTEATTESVIALFIDRLVEWNWVDEHGDPVPTTAEGVGRLDAAAVRTLAMDWLRRAADLLPLGRTAATATVSSNGAMESTLPMDPI